MQNRRTPFRNFLLAAAVLFFPFAAFAQTSAVTPRITAAVNESQLVTLRGNTHPYAQAQYDTGAAPDSLPMARMLLVLTRSAAQESALEALLAQQQDSASPNFHAWLTPQQFGQQFGPADADIQTITTWLGAQGFTVNRVSNGRTVIEFSGTAGQVRAAFHTQIHRYHVNGEDHWANASDPQIPAALAPVVAGINTLYNFPRHAMHELAGEFSRSRATGEVKPVGGQFTFPLEGPNGPITFFALGPQDFAKVYDVPNLALSPAPANALSGDGVTIAIVNESDINVQDVSDFRTLFGLPAPKVNQIVSGIDPGIAGAETEADLDVQWSGAVAPNATIDLVVAESTDVSLGVDLAAQYAVDNNLAPVMSESFGICEFFMGNADNIFYNQLWQQAAAEGITAIVSSGDGGSTVCDQNAETAPAQYGLSVNGFASTPYNVSVGGTDFNDLNNFSPFWNTQTNDTPTIASAKGYIPEMTWNDSCTNQEWLSIFGTSTAEQTCNNSTAQQDGLLQPIAGSGGKSSCIASDGINESSCAQGYAKPSWQTALTPNDGSRDLPDVSFFASNGFNGSFYLICERDAVLAGATSCDPYAAASDFLGIGGTSASAPAFAGIMALVNQATGSRQGNANYILYKLAAQGGASCTSAASPASTCVFYDVPSGSTNAMPCASGSMDCNTANPGDPVGVLSGYAAAAGYDQATGLGSVNAANLISKWKSFNLSLEGSSTTLTLNGGTAQVNLTHGQPVNVEVQVAPSGSGSGTPTGEVSLIAGTGQQGVQAFSLTAGGASGASIALPGGSYSVVAQYPGDGTFGPSTSTGIPVTVAPENSKIGFNFELYDPNTGALLSQNATTAGFGAFSILRVNVTSQAGDACASNAVGATGCPTGSVTLTDNGSPVDGGPFALNSEGYFTSESYGFTLTAGAHQLAATYGGDHSFNAASPTTETLTITPASTSTTLLILTEAYALTAPATTITGSVFNENLITSIPPTGTIKVFAGSTQIASNPVSGAAQPFRDPVEAGFSTTVTLPHGTNTFTAQYSGDQNYAASTSAAQTLTVYYPTQATLTLPSSLLQGSDTLTANVSGVQAGTAITGTVQFLENNIAVCSTPISANGQVTCNATLFAGNSTTDFAAVYSGDSNYEPATSNLAFQAVVGPGFTVTANPIVVAVSSPGQAGSTTLTFTATGGFSSNGAVTITPMCTGLPSETTCSSGTSVTIPANGTATATISFQTTAPSAVAPDLRGRPDIGRRNTGGWNTGASAWVLALACLLCAAMLAFGYRANRRRWGLALMFSAFALLAVSIGCGGGGGGGGTGPTQNPGTPVGNYTNVSVTVTVNGVTQTISGLTLNVE